MASYTMTCAECDHSAVERNVPMEKRNDVFPCPECGAEAYGRDVKKTLAAAGDTTAYHEDLITIVERRSGQDPNWRPPSSKGPEGRSRAGAGRELLGTKKRRWV